MISPSMVAFARFVDSIESTQSCARNGARDCAARISLLKAPQLFQRARSCFSPRRARSRLQARFTQANPLALHTRFRASPQRVYRIFAREIVARLIARLALPLSHPTTPQNLSTQNLNAQNPNTPSPTKPRHSKLTESTHAPSGTIWRAKILAPTPDSQPHPAQDSQASTPRAEVVSTQANASHPPKAQHSPSHSAKAPARPKSPAAGFCRLHSSADSTPPRHR